MSASERMFMEAAIAEAQKSAADPTGAVPRVGAVAVSHGQIVGAAHRAETGPGRHAEYILLEEKLSSYPLVHATIYTTLEPCTSRGEEKIPCAKRIIDRRFGRVVIGMLDPNPIVRGLGFRLLRQANIRTDIFPHELMSQVEDLNRDFIHAIEKSPVHQATEKIGVLAAKARHPLQQLAVNRALESSVGQLQSIYNGQIPIPGQEAGYFRRWMERADEYTGPQRVKAYIRLPAFEPEELIKRSWFQTFYGRLRELVHSGKLTIRYIFLLKRSNPSQAELDFLNRYKDFSEEIRIVDERGYHLASDALRPSIVLFENQRIAFTHDRAENMQLIEASEWIFEINYERLNKKFKDLEMASTVYFPT